jgi:hypothetical protein
MLSVSFYFQIVGNNNKPPRRGNNNKKDLEKFLKNFEIPKEFGYL